MGVPGRDERVSTDSTVNSGTRQDSRLVAACPSARSGMAQTIVVQFSHRTVSRACGTSHPRPVPPPAGGLDTPVFADVQPTRLYTFAQLQRAGILCTCCRFLGYAGSALTTQVYDRKWSLYCTWCTERQIDPIHISIGDLADFCLHRFDRVGLPAPTIHTYKAAILSALEPRQSFSMSQLAILNKLLNSFHKRPPPKPSPVPDWDIGLVLKAFSLPPFEPIQQASV